MRIVLPEFQRGETGHRGEDRQDPESHDDLVVGDAHHLEMMMDRGAEEDAFAVPEAEARALKPDGERFDDENEPDDRDQELLEIQDKKKVSILHT